MTTGCKRVEEVDKQGRRKMSVIMRAADVLQSKCNASFLLSPYAAPTALASLEQALRGAARHAGVRQRVQDGRWQVDVTLPLEGVARHPLRSAQTLAHALIVFSTCHCSRIDDNCNTGLSWMRCLLQCKFRLRCLCLSCLHACWLQEGLAAAVLGGAHTGLPRARWHATPSMLHLLAEVDAGQLQALSLPPHPHGSSPSTSSSSPPSPLPPSCSKRWRPLRCILSTCLPMASASPHPCCWPVSSPTLFWLSIPRPAC